MNRLSTILGLVVGAAVAFYVAFFAVANRTMVPVNLLVVSSGPDGSLPTLPLWAVVALSFLAGALVVGSWAALSAFRHARERRRLGRRVAQLQDELGRLRNAPLVEPPPSVPRPPDGGTTP